jgi:prephenate dehydrogenase
MGGSLGLAARRHGIEVSAYARSESSRKIAEKSKIADSIFDTPAEAVTAADLIILCTPIFTMPDLILEFMPNLKSGAVITDVGSTKEFLTQKITALLDGTSASFIGSHPMTGSEKSGADAARADLYREATVIVTKEEESDKAALASVTAFWQLMGANVTLMSAEEHDSITARTSHLPHLAAAALMACAARDDQDIAPFCGPGIRDATRIAEGSPAVWHDIIKSNRDAVLHELNIFSQTVQNLKDILQRKDFDTLREHLADSQTKRQKLDRR